MRLQIKSTSTATLTVGTGAMNGSGIWRSNSHNRWAEKRVDITGSNASARLCGGD
jgi:hypothetical protein